MSNEINYVCICKPKWNNLNCLNLNNLKLIVVLYYVLLATSLSHSIALICSKLKSIKSLYIFHLDSDVSCLPYPVLFLTLYNDMQTSKVPGNGRQCSQLLWTLPRKNWNHGWQQTHRAGLLWNQRIQHWTVGKASDQGKIVINKIN